MARLSYLPEDNFTLTELVGPREKGVHLTDLLRLLKTEREPAKFRNEEGEWEAKDLLRLEIGHTFEELLSGALNRRHPDLVRPQPITCDGVICSPDGWVPTEQRLEEWKATWGSLNRPLLDWRWYWFYQIKAYAYVLGATDAVLRVFYINGDYSRDESKRCAECGLPSGGPHVHAYRVTWYDGELEETWAELIGIGREYGLLPKPKLRRRA